VAGPAKKAPASPVWLLDANVLIALTQSAHVHHSEAHAWFSRCPDRHWATCAITQLAFLRLTSNPNVVGEKISPAQAMQALITLTDQAQHVYWPEATEPMRMPTLNSEAVVGHRQVTDAYLLGLALSQKQCLATLDRSLVTFAMRIGLSHGVELVSAAPAVHEAGTAFNLTRGSTGLPALIAQPGEAAVARRARRKG
jgi:uncharacterized protein